VSYIIKLSVILGTYSMIAAFALGGVYESTKVKIAFEKEKVMQEALKMVLPEAKNIIKTTGADGKVYYRGFATDDTKVSPVGYAIVAAGKGYSSTVQTLVGVKMDGSICGMNVLFQQETPGLGTKAVEVKYGEKDPWFQRQFMNLAGDTVAVQKDGGQIQSITGATITSRAITLAIKKEVTWLRQQGLITKLQK
jgi:Na+-translocating ferredoxin:NAD+ oxidoreductase subunit G